MASFETIEKRSLRYQIPRFYVDFVFHRYFRCEVVGLERLDPNKTYLFTPNHQGVLIDAMAILCMKPIWQPVFLARADIFKNRKVANILYYLKILPIFRIRDGYESLNQNDRVFQKTLDVLRCRNGLVMLPEGNHGAFKRLRQLKKGVARIAFRAHEAMQEPEIQIVPVGLDYSNYVNARSHLLVRLGEPFGLEPYLEQYAQNPAIAYNSLMDDLATRIKAEMIHIDTEEHYAAYMRLIDLFSTTYIRRNGLPRTRNQKFAIDKQLIAALDDIHAQNTDLYNDTIDKLNRFDNIITTYKLSGHAAPFRRSQWPLLPWQALMLLATLPVFVYGYVNNFLALLAPYKVSGMFKDKQFISSVRYVVSLFSFPLTYAIQTLVIGLTLSDWRFTLGYLLSLPLGLILAYLWRKRFYRFVRRCRLAHLICTKPTEANELNQLFDSLYGRFEGCVKIEGK